MALGTMKTEIRYQGNRLEKLDIEIAKLKDVVVTLARQDERLNAMDQRMLTQGKRLDLVTNQIFKHERRSEEESR